MMDLVIYCLVVIFSIPILGECFMCLVGLISVLIIVKTLKYMFIDD